MDIISILLNRADSIIKIKKVLEILEEEIKKDKIDNKQLKENYNKFESFYYGLIGGKIILSKEGKMNNEK